MKVREFVLSPVEYAPIVRRRIGVALEGPQALFRFGLVDPAAFAKDCQETVDGGYKVERIASDVITRALPTDVVAPAISVFDKESFTWASLSAHTEGISGGGPNDGVAVARERIADAGVRYLSKCHNDNWMRNQGYVRGTEGKY